MPVAPTAKDKTDALLAAIATGSINFIKRIWHELGIGIRRDAAILKTGKDPGYDAFAKMEDIKPTDIAAAAGDAVASILTDTFSVTSVVFKPVTDALLKVHHEHLDPLHDLKPGDEAKAASDLLTEAIGAGVSAHFAAVAAEAFYPTKNLGVPQIAALMAELAGFAEIMKGIIGPEVHALIGTPHTYKTNERARSNQPVLQLAAQLHARGLITEAQYDQLAGYAGIAREYAAPIATAATSGISPRQLLRAMDSGVLSDAELEDELHFAGMRDISIDRMKRIANWQALQPYRVRALAQLTNAYERGVIDTANFEATLAQLDLPDGAEHFIQLEASYKKLTQLAELYRKSVSEAYAYGEVTDTDYVARLEAAGLNPADAEAHYAIDSIKQRGKAAQAEERRLARIVGAQQRKDVELAHSLFLTGSIDLPAATAALIAAGEPPTLAAADAGVLQERKIGASVRVLNQVLPHERALELRAKIAAIQTQATKKLITPGQARQDLRNLGVSGTFADALAAKWTAQANKIILPI